MGKNKTPVTPAVRFLRSCKIVFKPFVYDYEDHGGAQKAAEKLRLDPYGVIKTLVMENELKQPFLVLMHGNKEVSVKKLARHLAVKKVMPCDAAKAHKLTGYKVGGISPFGTLKPMKVYAQTTLFELDQIYINGGKRGFLVKMDTMDLKSSLDLVDVDVAI